mgnify:CR=1 FL=1
MTDYPFTPLVASLPSTVPFVGPEAQERQRGGPFAARIGANENVFGPSKIAIAAMQGAAAETWMYGDPENHDLKAALAAKHGVAPENIVVGEGIQSRIETDRRQHELQEEIDELGLNVHARAVLARNGMEALPVIIQSFGLGKLRPNVVLFGLPESDEAPKEIGRAHV